jgi:hypothetical protein
MTQNINLKNNQREAYLYFHKDGLIDIAVGLGVLIFGLGVLVDLPSLAAILPFNIVILWKPIKKSFTAPRLGADDQELLETAAIRKTLALMSGLLLFLAASGLALFLTLSIGNVSTVVRDWMRAYIELGFGVFAAVVLSTVGVILNVQRFHFYALLTLLVFVGGYFLQAGLPVALVLTGAVIILAGLVVSWQFTMSHPVRAE